MEKVETIQRISILQASIHTFKLEDTCIVKSLTMVYYTSDCMFLDFLHRLVVKKEHKVSGIRTASILSLKGGKPPCEMGLIYQLFSQVASKTGQSTMQFTVSSCIESQTHGWIAIYYVTTRCGLIGGY